MGRSVGSGSIDGGDIGKNIDMAANGVAYRRA